ncbi:squalene synthase HpnC [Hydrogenophaga sp. PBL-H3]|uniref:squalene synthase HpnC n=1 Tax=Hydrogenophaga sp. PBL-H3 TaxID=434010 RepID=UPI00131FF2E6|nr:squalene synthase HpnC [Hydrogenophaga sp. PBL-H3]QHE76825.1 squalene synthase HpnC [Hydrogenophaga sp. PBL-H3]QHE81249.1 squalene synthase HpnC [Hydrogenophaga sp. PBL-H3]
MTQPAHTDQPPPHGGSTHDPAPAQATALGALGGGVEHYENFPVASWLCPPRLRPTIVAIYRFARTADDIADEGSAPAAARLADLTAYRTELASCITRAAGGTVPPSPERWPAVFGPLSLAIARHALPVQLLHDLLSAFEQDVRYTEQQHRYASTEELLGYCRLSANPVGRLLLHLYGVHDARSLQQSDQICSALQLINFWQDISRDLPNGRCYLPADTLRRQGLEVSDFESPLGDPRPAQQAVVAELCAYARGLMQLGAPLARRVPGRAGWELRLVVQGGLRILDRIAEQDHRSWQIRVKLQRADLPRLLWRALWM